MMSRCGSPTRRSTRRSVPRPRRAPPRAGRLPAHRRALRVPRARTMERGKKFVTPNVLISERPPEANDRAVPGHWEGDLILGLDSSAIGTLVERTTRFTLLLHLPRMAGAQRPAQGQEWAGPGRSRRRSGPRRDHGVDGQPADAAASVVDLGPRRRAQPVAARQQREHQRSASPVLPTCMECSECRDRVSCP